MRITEIASSRTPTLLRYCIVFCFLESVVCLLRLFSYPKPYAIYDDSVKLEVSALLLYLFDALFVLVIV